MDGMKNNMIAHLWPRQSLFFHHGNTQIFKFIRAKKNKKKEKELKPDKLAMGFRCFRLYSF